jgi:hypothetical protein
MHLAITFPLLLAGCSAQVHGPLGKILQRPYNLNTATAEGNASDGGHEMVGATSCNDGPNSNNSDTRPLLGLSAIKQLHQQRLTAAIQHRIQVLEEALDELPQVSSAQRSWVRSLLGWTAVYPTYNTYSRPYYNYKKIKQHSTPEYTSRYLKYLLGVFRNLAFCTIVRVRTRQLDALLPDSFAERSRPLSFQFCPHLHSATAAELANHMLPVKHFMAWCIKSLGCIYICQSALSFLRPHQRDCLRAQEESVQAAKLSSTALVYASCPTATSCIQP